jgi:hypothetical protein
MFGSFTDVFGRQAGKIECLDEGLKGAATTCHDGGKVRIRTKGSVGAVFSIDDGTATHDLCHEAWLAMTTPITEASFSAAILMLILVSFSCAVF